MCQLPYCVCEETVSAESGRTDATSAGGQVSVPQRRTADETYACGVTEKDAADITYKIITNFMTHMQTYRLIS